MPKVTRIVTVVRDGFHNGFTDLQHWQGNYWVAYRKGAGHASTDGEAVVSVSSDRNRFREVARLHVPGDVRDPKMLPIDDSRMALYFPSWIKGYEAREIQHYVTFSTNGYDWDEPRPILEPSKWLWRIRPHQGRYYGLVQNFTAGWDNGRPHELDLVISDDLFQWETIARIGDGLGLSESDIYFRPDGEAWLVSRTTKSKDDVNSYFAHANPPYAEWIVEPRHPMVHAPIFLEHEDALYVAGRSNPVHDGETTFAEAGGGASLSVHRVTRDAIEPVLRLPASGDCSYPGLIKDPDGRVCMSYYSQHAYHFGVVDPPSGLKNDIGQSVNDVYFAELNLSD